MIGKKKDKKQVLTSIDGFVPTGVSGGSRRSVFTDISDFEDRGTFDISSKEEQSFSGQTSNIDIAEKKQGKHRKGGHETVEFDNAHITEDSEDKKGAVIPKNKRRFIQPKTVLKCMIFIVVIGVAAYGAVGVNAYIKARNIFKGGGQSVVLGNNDVDPSSLKTEGDARINILLTGMRGVGDGAELTDTIVVASIDPISYQATLFGIPRDLWVKNGRGSSTKINQVYIDAKNYYIYEHSNETDSEEAAQKYGVESLETTVESILGVPIHFYAMVDFVAFRNAIDSLGGITIDVKTRVYDTFIMNDNYGNPLIADVGVQDFDGRRALLYAQSRHGSPRGDFDRSDRQREVIIAMKDKALTLGTFANPAKLNSLVNSFGNHVFTNLSLDDMSKVYSLMKEIDADKIISAGLADEQVDLLTDDISAEGLYITVPKEGTYSYEAIRTYVHSKMRDSFLAKENAIVSVVNASGKEGVATEKANTLKSYGYLVLDPQNADTIVDGSGMVLVDLTNGDKKYTKHYLEQRLGVKAVQSLPNGITNTVGAEFVIIITR